MQKILDKINHHESNQTDSQSDSADKVRYYIFSFFVEPIDYMNHTTE